MTGTDGCSYSLPIIILPAKKTQAKQHHLNIANHRHATFTKLPCPRTHTKHANMPQPSHNPTHATQHASVRNRRRFRFRVLAVVFGLGLAFLLAEIALRIIGVGYPLLFHPDYYCGSRLLPSTTGVWNEEGHGRVSVNSLGFRGKEIFPKQPNTFRIAVLGDSFVEALQVDEEQTFVSLLEKQLNQSEVAKDRQFEVINCGVSGYGTAQELLMLQNYVLPLEPDAVLLSVFPENDLWNNSRALAGDETIPYFTIDESDSLVSDTSFRQSAPWLTASTTYERAKRRIVNLSRTLQVIQRAKSKLFQPLAQQLDPNVGDDPTSALQAQLDQAVYVYRDSDDPAHQAAWQITQRLIAAIDSECKSRGIDCVVFTASSPAQVYPDQSLRDNLLQNNALIDLFDSDHRLQAFCQQSGISFVPLATMLAKDVESNPRFLHGFGHWLGYGHWNADGHILVAQKLIEVLHEVSDFSIRDSHINRLQE